MVGRREKREPGACPCDAAALARQSPRPFQGPGDRLLRSRIMKSEKAFSLVQAEGDSLGSPGNVKLFPSQISLGATLPGPLLTLPAHTSVLIHSGEAVSEPGSRCPTPCPAGGAGLGVPPRSLLSPPRTGTPHSRELEFHGIFRSWEIWPC